MLLKISPSKMIPTFEKSSNKYEIFVTINCFPWKLIALIKISLEKFIKNEEIINNTIRFTSPLGKCFTNEKSNLKNK